MLPNIEFSRFLVFYSTILIVESKTTDIAQKNEHRQS